MGIKSASLSKVNLDRTEQSTTQVTSKFTTTASNATSDGAVASPASAAKCVARLRREVCRPGVGDRSGRRTCRRRWSATLACRSVFALRHCRASSEASLLERTDVGREGADDEFEGDGEACAAESTLPRGEDGLSPFFFGCDGRRDAADDGIFEEASRPAPRDGEQPELPPLQSCLSVDWGAV